MTSMRARVAFPFRGRDLQPGDLLQAPPAEAAALRYQGKADFVEAGELPDSDRHDITRALNSPTDDRESASDDSTTPRPPKRTRKRRKDIQAEDLDQG